MTYTRYDSAAAFLRDTEEYLSAHETDVSLLYGVTLRVASGGTYGENPPYFASVHDDQTLVALAVQTPPFALILDLPTGDLAAIEPLIDALAEREEKLSGVHASSHVAESFAEAWCKRVGCRVEISRRMRTFVLTSVIEPRACPGRFRVATPADREVLVEWAEHFHNEALPGEPHRDMEEMVDRQLAAQTLHVWEDGVPVSMAATTRPMPRGMSIGLVYTPKSRRGRGYASACVATLSQKVLDAGNDYCTLYTDLANPISNSIYPQIGYRALADFLDVRFVEPEA